MRKGSVAFIFVTLLIDVLGFGLIIPVMPKFIAELSHHSISSAARDYGLLLSLYGAMQFLFSPMLGNLSDRFGRRPVLLLSLFFNGVDYAIMAFAPVMAWLYVGRILSGIAGASFTVASSYIADVSPPEKRAVNFGVIGAAFGVGFIIGPAAGGYLGLWGPRVPFFAAAILSIVNFIYGAFAVPESLSVENRRKFSLQKANPFLVFSTLSKYPVVWTLTASLVGTYIADRFIQSTWVLFMTYRFHWSVGQIGFTLTVLGVLSIVSQMGLAKFLIPRLGEKRTILIGMTAAVVEITGYALITQGWMVYVVMLLSMIISLASQSMQGLLSKEVPDNEQGALQGSLTSLSSLAGVLGPLAATFLFSYFTRPRVLHPIPSAPFLAAAFFYFLALVIAFWALNRKPPQRAKMEQELTAV